MSAVCRILSVVATLMLTTVAVAQDRCASDYFEKKALQKDPQQRSQFEWWMKKKISDRKKNDQSRSKTSAVYQVPVVVHILHNGEPVNSGANIPDAQVLSQIRVLNEDYKRMNADAVNTPAEFADNAGSIDLEFVLAKQDPDGLPTNGITRTLASQSGYTIDDDVEIKSQIYWPSEDYLNIWVTNLTDTYLGYAQYPVTNLQGTVPPYDALTDGVVIHYKAFGSLDDGAFNLVAKYNKGRTTTHEVGHFFGLLHVFGDFSGCGTTDYVDDTPVQSDRTFTCPSGPLTQCGHHVMYQNFLDYTDDACMNLFTEGQIERIQAVLDESPRRNSLLSSPGLDDPVLPDLDLEARKVAAPFAITCGEDIVPRVVIRNRGENTVTSAKISFSLNGSVVETKDATLNLTTGEETTVSFSTIDLPEPGSNNILFSIVQVNGIADDVIANDETSLTSQVRTRVAAPFLEAFNSMPVNWQVVNPDNKTTWQNITAPKAAPNNKAMYIDLFNYQNNSARDELHSAFIELPNENALLKFDRAYALFPGINNEKLRVLISVGCSTDLSEAVEIYSKSGADLATAPTLSSPFLPTGETQWGTDGISLSAYNGKIVQFIFESTNANGNNLYIDNVQVSTGEFSDMKLVSLVSPGPVFCDTQPEPVIEVQNLGASFVDNLEIVTEVNGAVNATETVTGLALSPGEMVSITLQTLSLTQSINDVVISISNPDAAFDDVPANNTISATRVLQTVRESIPLRQNFDNNVASWTIFSEGDQQRWIGTQTTVYGNSLLYGKSSELAVGNESWLVSPVLDMTKADQGSLFFNTSYAWNEVNNEQLKVLVSEDCGVTYNHLLFEKSGEDLSIIKQEASWVPVDSGDWKTEYVSLNDFAGKDNIRVAFVATAANGNNLFLDNIEFFMEDNEEPPRPQDLFAVYNSTVSPYQFIVTFNLPQKQDARLLVYNTLGQVMIDSQLPDALNQTFTVDLYGQTSGIYIARLLTPSLTRSAKVFIGK